MNGLLLYGMDGLVSLIIHIDLAIKNSDFP